MDNNMFKAGIGLGTLLGLIAGAILCTAYHSNIVKTIQEESNDIKDEIHNLKTKPAHNAP